MEVLKEAPQYLRVQAANALTRMYDTTNFKKVGSESVLMSRELSDRLTRARKASCAVACRCI